MRVLDVFAGIGGFSLGLHWAEMRTVGFCEADGFAAGVLRRHWPGVPVYPDIRVLDGGRLAADGIGFELLCGGFPCQDVSLAGRGAGLSGARSGLWGHMLRLVAECGPRWVVVENVPGLRGRGADRVCGELEAVGYAVWPVVVGAVHAGAPHRRQRVWIVARSRAAGPAAADAAGEGLEVGQRRPGGAAAGLPAERRGGWPAEPGLRRVDDGVPARVDRVRCLGNAVVPANAAMLGRAIMRMEGPGPAAGAAAVRRG